MPALVVCVNVRDASTDFPATQLLSFEFCGCGVLTFTDPDTELPPDFCGGGALKMRVTLRPTDVRMS